MTVLFKGRFFGVILLSTMIDHEFWIRHCHHQLEKYQATHDPAYSKFMDVLEISLQG